MYEAILAKIFSAFNAAKNDYEAIYNKPAGIEPLFDPESFKNSFNNICDFLLLTEVPLRKFLIFQLCQHFDIDLIDLWFERPQQQKLPLPEFIDLWSKKIEGLIANNEREESLTKDLPKLLYRVEKKGVPTSYLLGTIHLHNEWTEKIYASCLAYIDDCQYFLNEINFDSLEFAAAKAVASSQETYDEILGSQLVELVQQALGGNIEFIEFYQVHFKLLALRNNVRKNTSTLLDTRLFNYAKHTQTARTIALETLEEQLYFFKKINNFSENYKRLMICQSLSSKISFLDKVFKGEAAIDYSSFIDSQITLKSHFLSEEDFSLYKSIYQDGIEHRDKVLFERSLPYFNKGKVFMAVGAFHLSIINNLKKEGFTFTPILINKDNNYETSTHPYNIFSNETTRDDTKLDEKNNKKRALEKFLSYFPQAKELFWQKIAENSSFLLDIFSSYSELSIFINDYYCHKLTILRELLNSNFTLLIPLLNTVDEVNHYFKNEIASVKASFVTTILLNNKQYLKQLGFSNHKSIEILMDSFGENKNELADLILNDNNCFVAFVGQINCDSSLIARLKLLKQNLPASFSEKIVLKFLSLVESSARPYQSLDFFEDFITTFPEQKEIIASQILSMPKYLRVLTTTESRSIYQPAIDLKILSYFPAHQESLSEKIREIHKKPDFFECSQITFY